MVAGRGQETSQTCAGREVTDESELAGFTRACGRSAADTDRRVANGRSGGQIFQQAARGELPVNSLADDPVAPEREVNGIEGDRAVAQVELRAGNRSMTGTS